VVRHDALGGPGARAGQLRRHLLGAPAAVAEDQGLGQPGPAQGGRGVLQGVHDLQAHRALDWARYYEDARTLARLLTAWTQTLESPFHRFVVCSGGGPGIMEAANRGAREAGGKTIGLNIGLPREQRPNPYITRELSFEFHYFFMRKLWFAHLARALVVFPGGFGTLDELFEILTLAQTRKLDRQVPVVLYGASYWNEIVDFQAMVRHGVIDAADVGLF
jgi:uncharacterized protein (TIGR00730 family)